VQLRSSTPPPTLAADFESKRLSGTRVVVIVLGYVLFPLFGWKLGFALMPPPTGDLILSLQSFGALIVGACGLAAAVVLNIILTSRW